MVRNAGALFVLASLVLFVGCATPPDGPPYPLSKAQVMKPGCAVLYVYRAYAEPTRIAVGIDIDGEEVSSLGQGAFTWVYAKPGMRLVGFAWADGAATHTPGVIALNVAEGNTYYLELWGQFKPKITMGPTGYPVVTPTEVGSWLVQTHPDIAEQRLTACCSLQTPRRQEY